MEISREEGSFKNDFNLKCLTWHTMRHFAIPFFRPYYDNEHWTIDSYQKSAALYYFAISLSLDLKQNLDPKRIDLNPLDGPWLNLHTTYTQFSYFEMKKSEPQAILTKECQSCKMDGVKWQLSAFSQNYWEI